MWYIVSMATATQHKDLEFLIEQKIIELYGDPDEGLTLRKDFLTRIQKSMQKKQKYISHEEVLKKYGVR